ncbi:alanine:cation symporter family protein [Tessaracoccus coleopterorum]|uniref:alanine:cation symporter family protein n=1 Tax=Tessaracoccus coleopterorum TaxID=2714950 RepID=UPI001E38A24C|nr:alanine:cation symporter family protein [Tessaracoccus coleopterorum]
MGDWSAILLSIIIFLLAFSSILGNYYYGESNVEFITRNPTVLTAYRVFAVIAVLVGSVATADLVWNIADGIMGIMALVNLVAIALLSRLAFRLLQDYNRQRREGRDPVFTRDLMPEVSGIQCWEDERTVTGPLTPVVRGRPDAERQFLRLSSKAHCASAPRSGGASSRRITTAVGGRTNASALRIAAATSATPNQMIPSLNHWLRATAAATPITSPTTPNTSEASASGDGSSGSPRVQRVVEEEADLGARRDKQPQKDGPGESSYQPVT